MQIQFLNYLRKINYGKYTLFSNKKQIFIIKNPIKFLYYKKMRLFNYK